MLQKAQVGLADLETPPSQSVVRAGIRKQVHDRGMFIHMYTVTCFLMNNFKSCLHKKSRKKIILFFTEMRKIRIS